MPQLSLDFFSFRVYIPAFSSLSVLRVFFPFGILSLPFTLHSGHLSQYVFSVILFLLFSFYFAFVCLSVCLSVCHFVFFVCFVSFPSSTPFLSLSPPSFRVPTRDLFNSKMFVRVSGRGSFPSSKPSCLSSLFPLFLSLFSLHLFSPLYIFFLPFLDFAPYLFFLDYLFFS